MFDADDVLRYAFRQGAGRDLLAGPGTEQPLTTTFGNPPAGVMTDGVASLAWGTSDLLDDTAYPEPCAVDHLAADERLHHALIMAFGLLRREPSNLFNDHRGCASVRSRFPVHTYVLTPERAWLLDLYRHGLLPLATPIDRPAGDARAVVLAGRYTHLPSLYGRLRGPLVEMELGISLRCLYIGLQLMGLSGDLDLPGPDAGALMADLAMDPPSEWTAPLTIAIARPKDRPVTRYQPAPGRAAAGGRWLSTGRGDPIADDPTLQEVVSVNRTALDVAAVLPIEASRGQALGLPTLHHSTSSWSDVLWHRNAGRMPRQTAGFSGRRSYVAADAVDDAVAWLDVPPPTPLLAEVSRHISVYACIQDVDGYRNGGYQIRRGHLELDQAEPNLAARLEACYGQRLSPTVGCAVRHASMVWLMSVDLAALVDALGPGGWTLCQYACGWMAHGLCLSAAAHRLYARPSRAFDELALSAVTGSAPDRTLLLAVVCGVGRFLEPMLDLRT